MRRLALIACAASASFVAASAAAGAARAAACPPQRLSAAYVARVDRALRSGRDAWGAPLVASRGGPTYAGARRYLTPLLLARGAHGTRLTDTGYHYVPFTDAAGAGGTSAVALHVADGSEILFDHAGGRHLDVSVGDGRERYGSCLSRLGLPRFRGGSEPVLETRYADAHGSRYTQESFAGRLAGTPHVSFVALTVVARRPTTLRLVSSSGGTVIERVAPGTTATLYAAWPWGGAPRQVDAQTYAMARAAAVAAGAARVGAGASIEVPEQRVDDAERALLLQNLILGWRYSIGNPYEEFSVPESLDVAEVMADYGFGDTAKAILRTALTRPRRAYANWQEGQELVATAAYDRLFRDGAYVESVTPQLSRYVSAIGAQVATGGMLRRERYSSDIADSVRGLHSQAVVWQGLRTIAAAWRRTGHPQLARRADSLATRLERSLRAAVRASEVRLVGGALFLPVGLLDHEPAYAALTASRSGSYWNLVAPYALGSGLFAPGSREARGALAYIETHGSRLLGLVRAGGYALYGHHPRFPQSGTDEVYGLNVSRFLADNDEPDELVLSLYGQLAGAMAPGTFVSGEAASVAPLGSGVYRTMYLPPNAASNASFLETLRLLLVHETSHGLDLAFATPRSWLRPGANITVNDLPTRFGPLSFELHAHAGSIDGSFDLPQDASLKTVRLRLRLPAGDRATRVSFDGGASRRVNAQTISLPGRAHLELAATLARG